MDWRIEHHEVASHGRHRRTRSVTIAIPASTVLQPPTVIYCADGQVVELLVSQLQRSDGKGRPPVLIGVDSDPAARAREYLPSSSELFLDHERFFCEEVRIWAQATFGIATAREHSAVFGFSNGGAFALTAAIRQPARFAAAIALSVPPLGQPLPIPATDTPMPLIYLAAGNQGPEKSIRKNVLKLAKQLRGAGFSVEFHERAAGHDLSFWSEEFAAAMDWLDGKLAVAQIS